MKIFENKNGRLSPAWLIFSLSFIFSPQGAFPVHTVKQKTLQKNRLPVWQRILGLLTELSGLVHDYGKYSQHFQHKLRHPQKLMDKVRHEWLSVCLLRVLYAENSGETGSSNDFLWKEAWENAWKSLDICKEHVFINDTLSMRNVAISTAWEALEYLVASHHRLFADDNSFPTLTASHVRDKHFDAPYTTPFAAPTEKHLQHVAAIIKRLNGLVEQQGEMAHSYWWSLVTLSRVALIFADHTVSAQNYKENNSPKHNEAAANTDKGTLKQSLEWHLENVAHVAGQTAWRLGQYFIDPKICHSVLDGLQECSLASILEPAEEKSRFHWQNNVAAALMAWRQEHEDTPCLVFSLAGTGSGKTRLNIRSACILSLDASPRCSIALNLRSLTLQTGKALQKELGILSTDMATVIGDRITQKLFTWDDSQGSFTDSEGNHIEQEFYCQEGNLGENAVIPAWMEPIFTDKRQKTLISTPVLVSTIDFLIAAGNPQSQGHHVKAVLRMLSSDLILDEIDSYDPEALVAVLRLVQLCAFFKRNVICSSATLSQSVADAVHAAWKSGLELRRSLLQDSQNNTEKNKYGVALVDDVLIPSVQTYNLGEDTFSADYTLRLQEFTKKIQQIPTYRHAFLQKFEATVEDFYDATLTAVQRLHLENTWAFSAQKRVSFGLIRMANIQGAVHMARHVAQHIPNAYVACYHANDWRINRYHKERRLDFLLKRKNSHDEHIIQDAEIQRLVAQRAEQDVLFIVVATPVEEVGRDHDFDWAVIEPSSAQSIVQTAGRVNRHRVIPLQHTTNIALLQYNLRHCKNSDAGDKKSPAFIYPGFEAKKNKAYLGHDVEKLLPWYGEGKVIINASLRLGEGSAFAKADDVGIGERVGKYFGTYLDKNGSIQEGIFTKLPIAATRMTAAPYKDTPLRSPSHKSAWRLRRDKYTEHLIFECFNSAGKYEDWVPNDDVKEVAAMPNAWLYLSPLQMCELCHEVGISETEGLYLEINRYIGGGGYARERFEYDVGFGVCREVNE